MTSNSAVGSFARPCVKCKAQEATLDSRSHAVCSDCFVKFVSAKCIKQIGLLGKETPTPRGTTRRFVLGLSRGVSSTALLHLLNENVEFQLGRGRSAPFGLTVVYVDPFPSSSSSGEKGEEGKEKDSLAEHRVRYPRFTFRTVPLSSALALRSVNWSLLPFSPDPDPKSSQSSEGKSPDERLHALFASLPSAASRADLLRLLTRHVLLATAVDLDAQALLLGHSTTALAELTLAETAKGRGFSLPWMVHDGPVAVTSYSESHPTSNPHSEFDSHPPEDPPTAPSPSSKEKKQVLVYHPLRDILRKELQTCSSLIEPPLSDLISAPDQITIRPDTTAIISHKDLSIDEVMVRYFAEVEQNYPSVVANVARTTGKLVRLLGGGGEQGRCGLCGMPLDELGDERWRGELGIDRVDKKGICYGCERSTRG